MNFRFHKFSKSGLTKIWIAEYDKEELGVVLWKPEWRKYWFEPFNNTGFEEDCLREIAVFIEEQTRLHKAQNKIAKVFPLTQKEKL
jgi:hypothetical protein